MLPGSSGFQCCIVSHLTELTKRWFGLENDNDKTAQWLLLQTRLHSSPLLYCPSTVSSWRLYGIYLSRFSRCNYSFSFTMEHYTLFGATSYTWQLTKVIICPVFLSVFKKKNNNKKNRTGLCFCWSLPFLLVTDVQPPLCWRPRKFWTAALFASRDWCKVFKVKSVVCFFFFFK